MKRLTLLLLPVLIALLALLLPAYITFGAN